jgi:hypothetical protein
MTIIADYLTEDNLSNSSDIFESKFKQINLFELNELSENSWVFSISSRLGENSQLIKINLDQIQDNFTWLIVEPDYPLLTAKELNSHQIGWLAKAGFLQKLFNHQLEQLFNPYEIIRQLIETKIITKTLVVNSQTPSLNRHHPQSCPQTILAIIPHLNCNQWLNYCLFSLVNQTQPLTNIVVVDDGSTVSPEAICRQYSNVTLLTTSGRVGPYQIIQSLIEKTNYDAYLFQDADDWSIPERLEILLRLMKATGADLVGTQEYRVDDINQTVIPVSYPLDVNLALREKPGHALLHPTSLISRSAVFKLNGFANGLLFGGDTEFLLRAHFHLKICNSPEFAYFRRKRFNSLTTSAATGLDSPVRREMLQQFKEQAYANYARINQGQSPFVNPVCRQKITEFKWICGQKLRENPPS